MDKQTRQTRLESLIEAILNICVGYSIAMVSQIVLFPLFDIHVGMSTHLWLSFWFTCISLIRSYTIRRVFNMPKVSHKLLLWIEKVKTK